MIEMCANILITFVIPSFCDARILECIKSIRDTDIPWAQREIIIQDAGSSNALLAEINSLLSNNDRLIVEKDSGIFDGINRGLSKAHGQYILTLGSDDRVYKLLHSELKFHLENKVDIIVADLAYTGKNWEVIRYWPSRKISMWQYLLGRQYAHFSLICTKNVYEHIGYFNVNNKVNADYEFFYFLCKNISKFRQSYSRSIKIQMRLGGNSSASIRSIFFANINLLRFILKNNKILLVGFFIKPLHKYIEYFNRSKFF